MEYHLSFHCVLCVFVCVQSREERKNEAVWKVFEKMEASTSRRKNQLMSEDSDPIPSSPIPTTPSMLGPKHR